MKRTSETDDEWQDRLDARKARAEREMLIADHMKGFVTLAEIGAAARAWGCSEHEAELRLIRGEMP